MAYRGAPALHLKRRTVSTQALQINWSSPLARGLSVAYPLRNGALFAYPRLTRGQTLTGTRAVAMSPSGVYLDLDGSSYITRGGTLLPSDTTPFTVSWYSVAHAVPTYASIMGTRPTGSANPFFIIRSASANYHLSAGPVAGLLTICAWTAGDGVLPALTAGMEERMVLVCAGGTSSHNVVSNYRLARNGVYLGVAPNAATAYGSSSSTAEVHGWDGGDDKWDGVFGDFIVWERALTVAEQVAYSAEPEQLWKPLIERLYFTAASAGSVTGTGASTIEPVTSAGAGVHGVSGTAASTVGAVTSSASGVHGVTGTGASTVGAVTSSGAAVHGVSGSAASTVGDITSAGEGTFTEAGAGVTGTGASTVGAITSAASGVHGVSGTGASTVGAVTSAGAGVHGVTGTGASTIGPVLSAGTGSGGVATGAVTATLQGDGSAIIGLCDTGTPVTPSQSAEY